MTKEEYIQRVFDVRQQMCTEIANITQAYVNEHASNIPEVETDGLYLKYDEKNPRDVHLLFSTYMSCDIPNVIRPSIKPFRK